MKNLLTRLKKIWSKIWGNFPPSSQIESTYELVETQLDNEIFRQGIRIKSGKYARVVVTISPKVHFNELADGTIELKFDHFVEYCPSEIEIDRIELHNVVGDILMDIIKKEYKDAPRATDTEHSSEG